MITKEKALTANEFHAEGGCSLKFSKQGRPIITIERWARNGKNRTKVKTPEYYEIPVKRGFYQHSVVKNGDEAIWHTAKDCEVLNRSMYLTTPVNEVQRVEAFN